MNRCYYVERIDSLYLFMYFLHQCHCDDLEKSGLIRALIWLMDLSLTLWTEGLFCTQHFYFVRILTDLWCWGRSVRALHSAGNDFSGGRITFVAVWLKGRCVLPFGPLCALYNTPDLPRGRLVFVLSYSNNSVQSGAGDLNRRCLLLISGQELFSFKGLLMCRQWNISSAYLLFSRVKLHIVLYCHPLAKTSTHQSRAAVHTDPAVVPPPLLTHSEVENIL